jgi:competence protein ComEC
VQDDVPAALPLLAFVAGLAAADHLVNPATAIGGSILLALLIRRARIALLFAALGVAIGGREYPQPPLPPDRFITIEAPIAGDWSERRHAFALRANSFRAGGDEFDSPLTIYARFTPPRIGMEELVRAEGFLRLDERGRHVLSVKSRRLLTYAGRLRWFDPASWNRRLAIRLRRHARDHPEEIAMIEALVLGRGERLSEETREGFKRGGTYHLLVFSGMQIALAAAIIAMILRWSGATRASDWSLLAFAVIAPLFIGPTASVIRASSGIALYAISRILERPTSIENLFCVAALMRLIVEPRDLGDPAFQLTYAGAGALLFIGKPLARSAMRWMAYAAGAELAIAPITLFHFHQYALGGSLLTIVMTPVVFVMLLIGVLFCATERIFLLRAIALLDGLCDRLNAAGAYASGYFAAPALPAIAASFGAALAAMALLKGKWRVIAIVSALAIAPLSAVIRHVARARVEHPEVVFLDVGQGDAILIRSGKRAALIDAGVSESAILPQLVDRGVNRLEFMLLTHAHPDHCGGIPALLRHLEVNRLLVSPRRFRGECARNILEQRAPSLLENTTRITLGDVTVTVIPPGRTFKRAPENNASVVAVVEVHGRRLLLTGDIEREQELDLIGRPLSQADLVKIAHHGSRSSTLAPFLDEVRPRLAVISCGRRNVFGHPHPAVLERLTNRRVKTWRTDRHGSVTVSVRDRILMVRGEIDTPR